MIVAEIRIVCWMCRYTRLDMIINLPIRDKVGVTSIDNKMREARLRWFRYVRMMSVMLQ